MFLATTTCTNKYIIWIKPLIISYFDRRIYFLNIVKVQRVIIKCNIISTKYFGSA